MIPAEFCQKRRTMKDGKEDNNAALERVERAQTK